MKNKEESINFYIALFMLFMAVTNIVLVIIKAPEYFLRPFSIGISVFVFYLAWKQISELETYKKLKMLFYLHHLEKEAQKEAERLVKNVVEQES